VSAARLRLPPIALSTESLYIGSLVSLNRRLKVCVANAFGEFIRVHVHKTPAESNLTFRLGGAQSLLNFTIESNGHSRIVTLPVRR
jgi:hypothetical protein